MPPARRVRFNPDPADSRGDAKNKSAPKGRFPRLSGKKFDRMTVDRIACPDRS